VDGERSGRQRDFHSRTLAAYGRFRNDVLLSIIPLNGHPARRQPAGLFVSFIFGVEGPLLTKPHGAPRGPQESMWQVTSAAIEREPNE